LRLASGVVDDQHFDFVISFVRPEIGNIRKGFITQNRLMSMHKILLFYSRHQVSPIYIYTSDN
jgi:hypothetical protein